MPFQFSLYVHTRWLDGRAAHVVVGQGGGEAEKVGVENKSVYF